MKKAEQRFTVIRQYQVIDNTTGEAVDAYSTLAAAKQYAAEQNQLSEDDLVLDVLADENMKHGYGDRIATRAARLAMAAIPADIRPAIFKEILAGDERTIALYRWPLCKCPSEIRRDGKHLDDCGQGILGKLLFETEDLSPKLALLSKEEAAAIRKQSTGGGQ